MTDSLSLRGQPTRLDVLGNQKFRSSATWQGIEIEHISEVPERLYLNVHEQDSGRVVIDLVDRFGKVKARKTHVPADYLSTQDSVPGVGWWKITDRLGHVHNWFGDVDHMIRSWAGVGGDKELVFVCEDGTRVLVGEMVCASPIGKENV